MMSVQVVTDIDAERAKNGEVSCANSRGGSGIYAWLSGNSLEEVILKRQWSIEVMFLHQKRRTEYVSK